MTKVCHFTSVHNTDDVRIFRKECTSLAQAGYDVYLVGRGENREENGVHVIGVGQPSGGRLSRMTGFAKKVYEAALALDADIYHFHDPELMPYGLKLKRKGKKVIFDSHEFYTEQITTKTYLGPFRYLVAKIYASYETYVVKQLDGIIVVTPRMRKNFQHIQPRVSIITNYPILENRADTHKNQPNVVCFAGGVSSQWNHETILHAMEQLPDVHYVLCGPGSDDYLAKLASMPTWDRVDYLGRVPFARAQQVLHTSAIGLALAAKLYGDEGTLGNTKLFEIMMAGLPVVCTDFILWKEIIDKYHCGICVKPDDPDAVAGAIRYLLDNPEEAKRMGENGRKAVENEYNWDTIKPNLYSLYKAGGVRSSMPVV